MSLAKWFGTCKSAVFRCANRPTLAGVYTVRGDHRTRCREIFLTNLVLSNPAVMTHPICSTLSCFSTIYSRYRTPLRWHLSLFSFFSRVYACVADLSKRVTVSCTILSRESVACGKSSAGHLWAMQNFTPINRVLSCAGTTSYLTYIKRLKKMISVHRTVKYE